MLKAKMILTTILFFGSCFALFNAHVYISAILQSYSTSFPAAFGGHAPAFTTLAISVMTHTAAICFGAIGASLTFLMATLRWGQGRDTKLYWVGVLASVNYYIAMSLFAVVLIGFFLLPKLANGI